MKEQIEIESDLNPNLSTSSRYTSLTTEPLKLLGNGPESSITTLTHYFNFRFRTQVIAIMY